MKFISKKLLGGMLLTSFVPATLLLASCSTTDESSFDSGISKETGDYYGTKLKEVTPAVKARKTMLITAGGLVNDKSFNQSVLESMKLYQRQAEITDKETITYKETTDNAMLSVAYDEALAKGYQTWILTSFQQSDYLKTWLNIADNKTKFIEKKITIIGVDWDGSSFVPEGQFFGLGFKTQESSWVVGYAASEYLSTTDTPYLSSFGGGVFDGVVDFNNGFLQGMLDWNTNNPKTPVRFHSGNMETDKIVLNTGFESTSDAMQIVKDIVGTSDSKSPKIILPVAGSLGATTLDDIKAKKSGQMIIGVDSNQALAFPSDKETFFSSVEKKVAVGVYKALMLIAGIPLDFISADKETNDKGFEGAFAINVKNAFVKYGFDKGLVGYSPSTLAGEEAAKVNALLDKSFKLFNEKKPIFEVMTDAGKNQILLNAIIVKINTVKSS